MPSRPLLWQLFPSYLLITLVALLAVGWFASESLQKSHYATVRNELDVRGKLIEPFAIDLLREQNVDRAVTSLDSFALATSTRVTVVRTGGKVLYDSSKEATGMDDHSNRPEIVDAMSSGSGDSTRFSTTNQIDMMYVARRIDGEDRPIGVVRTSVPVTDLDSTMHQMQLKIAGWGLLVAVLAGVLSWLFSRRIVQPIEAMRRAAERFAAGDLTYRLPLPRSAELASLAAALNTTADQLSERIATISQQSSQQDVVLGSMAEGVLAVGADDRIIAMNDAAAVLLETNRDASIGRDFRRVVGDAEMRTMVSRVAAERSPIQQDMVTRGLVQRIIQVRATPIAGDTPGGHSGVVVVLGDVTNMRRLETLRRDFVANVSHELRTPIASIKGFVETLQEGALRDGEDAKRFLQIIGRQADRLGAIIEDLLSLAKIEEREGASDLQLAHSAILQILSAAAADCQISAQERDITMNIDCDPELIGNVNATLLRQAVTNLLDNAVKYSDDGASIEVSAGVRDGQITIDVRDHGPGIDAVHWPRLFERFYRVDKARSRKLGGTGLGLAIVKHIVQAHGGTVAVDSILGDGSTFTIYLPPIRE
jgi:two-component system phosphate regulon sensor histidine kinase PhoR